MITHIFDNVNIDASLSRMLKVPCDDYSSFPSPGGLEGGLFYDIIQKILYYSDGSIWKLIGGGSVTSVNASISGALSVTGGPITTSGTLAFSWTGTSSQYVRGDGSLATFPSIPAGTVTSVALLMPTGFTVSGSPITTSGTLAVSMAAGYVIPTTTQVTNWNTAYGWGDSKGRYVALNDSNAGYSNWIVATDDLNDYTKSQHLHAYASVNAPTANHYMVMVLGHLANRCAQIALRSNNRTIDGFYYRGNDGTWGLWWQVASREWVTAQGYTTNTGTVTSVGASVGGTALTVTGSPITSTGTLAFTWLGTAGQYVDGTGSLQTFPSIPSVTPSTLTKTDDANVTLTLGGTPATSLLQAVSLTLGWTGVLAIGRGGTGLSSLGTLYQLLRVNGAGTALEYFTPTWTSNTGTVTSVGATTSGALSVSGSPITTSGTLAFSWTGTTSQYVRGNGSLATFPSIPTVNWSDESIAFGRTSISGLTYSSEFRYHYLSAAITSGTRGAGVIGLQSFVVGNNCIASGGRSVAFGENNNISGLTSVGSGYGNTVSSNYSFATGYNGTLSLPYSFMSGRNNVGSYTSGGGSSFIAGQNNTITDTWYAFVAGYNNTINAAQSSAILGNNGSITHMGNIMLLDQLTSPISSVSQHHFTARFNSGYRFMKSASVRMMELNSSGQLTIDNLAGSGTRMVVADSTGLLSTQTIPSGVSAVWKVQGGTTDATTNTQDIYHDAKVKIGNSTASSFQLSVVGQTYISAGAIINNSVYYQGYTTSVTAINLLGMNNNNCVVLGASGYDILLPAYPNNRSDSLYPVNFLGTTSTGILNSFEGYLAVNGHGSKYRSGTINIGADGDWYNLTLTSVSSISYNSPFSWTGADNNLVLTKQGYYLIHYMIEYTNQGGVEYAYNVSVRLKYNGSVISNTVRNKNVKCYREIIDCHHIYYVGSGGSALTMDVMVGADANGITIQKAELTALFVGIPVP